MQRIHDRGNIGKLILDVEKSPTPLVSNTLSVLCFCVCISVHVKFQWFVNYDQVWKVSTKWVRSVNEDELLKSELCTLLTRAKKASQKKKEKQLRNSDWEILGLSFHGDPSVRCWRSRHNNGLWKHNKSIWPLARTIVSLTISPDAPGNFPEIRLLGVHLHQVTEALR